MFRATALRDLLGAKLVAYFGGVKDSRAVRQWAEGSRKIANRDDVERLRVAYRAARMINLRDSTQVVQAWFQGLNPFLVVYRRRDCFGTAMSTLMDRGSSPQPASSQLSGDRPQAQDSDRVRTCAVREP